MYTLLIGKLRKEQKNTLFKFNQKNSLSEEEKCQYFLDDFPGILLQVLLRRTKNIFILPIAMCITYIYCKDYEKLMKTTKLLNFSIGV